MNTNSKQTNIFDSAENRDRTSFKMAETIIRNPETGEEIFRGVNKVIISDSKTKKTVGKKRRARKFIRTHIKQMSAFLLTEGIALYGLQRSPDGSIFNVVVIRKGLADKWVDEHEWHPNEHFLYKVWYYADYTHKTMPKYLAPAMITFVNLNHAVQRAQEDGDTEMADLIRRALKNYDYKTKIRRNPINGRKNEHI